LTTADKVPAYAHFVSRGAQSTATCFILQFASPSEHIVKYEPLVLDEIGDPFSAKDKDVEFVLKGKSLTQKHRRVED